MTILLTWVYLSIKQWYTRCRHSPPQTGQKHINWIHSSTAVSTAQWASSCHQLQSGKKVKTDRHWENI